MSVKPMSDLFGSGAGNLSSIVQYAYVTESKTITALRDGTLDVFISGGSGSGGVIFGSAGFLGGAGAGEAATQREITVLAGDTFTVTIGAGGAAVSRTTAGVTGGNAGSASTITGPGVSITVNGGAGAPSSATAPVAGGAGGTGGTGGDVHLAGGDGGDVAAAATAHGIGGGGAVAAIPTPPEDRKGGSVTGGGSIRGGGAGVGGVGLSTNSGPASGGGSGGAPTVFTAGGVNFLGRPVAASPVEFIQSFSSWGVDVFGGGGTYTNAPGPGGGSAGGSNSAIIAMPGIFAGGGAPASNVIGLGVAHHGTGSSAQGSTGTITSMGGGSGACILVFKD